MRFELRSMALLLFLNAISALEGTLKDLFCHVRHDYLDKTQVVLRYLSGYSKLCITPVISELYSGLPK